MKLKCMILAVGVVVLFASCRKDSITGKGLVKTEDRALNGFVKVLVEGATNIHITKGNSFDVSVKAYSNLLPYLITRVENGALIVKYENTTNVRGDNSEVFITMPVLNGLSAKGSGNIDVKGMFEQTPSFTAEISGSSNISIERASAEKLLLNIAGSGQFKSFGLMLDEADISISGSGDVEVTVIDKLKARINGSGNIYYKGNPGEIEQNISGSGKLIKR